MYQRARTWRRESCNVWTVKNIYSALRKLVWSAHRVAVRGPGDQDAARRLTVNANQKATPAAMRPVGSAALAMVYVGFTMKTAHGFHAPRQVLPAYHQKKS